MSEKRYLVKGYGVAPNGENIFGIFDSRTKSPYHLYAFNDDGLNKIARIMNEQQSTIQSLKEENDRIKTKGLEVLAFYESKLKNVIGTEDFQSVRDEIWIVRQVLYEMGVINDE